jgi:ABC-type Fe3+ transport system substrate-binding protein
LQALIAYLTGPEFGRICADAFFPALHPQVNDNLPDKAVLKWLGWDYIRGQDTGELLARLNKNFIM